MTDTRVALDGAAALPTTQAGISWTQGVRDGWVLAIDTLRAGADAMQCPDIPCEHRTEWECAAASLQQVATFL